MKTKFNSASKKDRFKVTLNLPQLDGHNENDGVPRSCLTRDSMVIVTIKGRRKKHTVLFTPNRFREGLYETEAVTAATNSWPRELRLPKTGKPVTYEVLGVSYV